MAHRIVILSTLLALTTAAAAAPVEGVVVRVDPGEVIVDLGRASGLTADKPIQLYRRLVVTHPITGQKLEDRFPIGSAPAAEVGDLLTIVRDVTGLERPPEVGDFVVFESVRPPTTGAPSTPTPTPGRRPDEEALNAIYLRSLGEPLSTRIELFESFNKAFPTSPFVDPVGVELNTLRALRNDLRGSSGAPKPPPRPAELTVR
ncbi:MAG: hypothetical protein KC620_26280, partial [Myxococcales bacterium]|nr:hypothetical protein [Myxococcales bacterium]